jgi:ADP-ribose pyrophosphatase YjhB (NUDIX family)
VSKDAAVPAMRFEDYPRPSVAADLAIITVEMQDRKGAHDRPRLPLPVPKVLLIRRREEPYAGRWALPGGFLRPNETIEGAALRELAEETRVQGVPLRLLKTYSAPERDPRGWVISVAFCALIPWREELPIGGSDAAEARWAELDSVNPDELAFDHATILRDAREWVQTHALTTTAVKDFLPERFVLAELYEVLRALVPGYDVESVNFRRKVIKKGIIVATDESEARYSRRPAQLFRFAETGPDAKIF